MSRSLELADVRVSANGWDESCPKSSLTGFDRNRRSCCCFRWKFGSKTGGPGKEGNSLSGTRSTWRTEADVPRHLRAETVRHFLKIPIISLNVGHVAGRNVQTIRSTQVRKLPGPRNVPKRNSRPSIPSQRYFLYLLLLENIFIFVTVFQSSVCRMRHNSNPNSSRRPGSSRRGVTRFHTKQIITSKMFEIRTPWQFSFYIKRTSFTTLLWILLDRSSEETVENVILSVCVCKP